MKIILSILLIFSFISPAKAYETRILINIPSRTLELWQGQKIKKTYRIGVGRSKFPTPIGRFRVISKIRNPGWENPYKPAGKVKIKPGKGNPLGTRWMGFLEHRSGEYGMHGTNKPSSVGKFSSHGCIRLTVRNAEELYHRVEIDTPVEIKYYPYKLKVSDGSLIVKKYPNTYKRKVNIKKSVEEQLKFLQKNYFVDKEKVASLSKLKNGASSEIGYIIPDDKISEFIFINWLRWLINYARINFKR